MFPLAVMKDEWEIGDWVRDYEKHWLSKEAQSTNSGDEVESKFAAQHAANAHTFGEYLKDITRDYQITYIELDRDLQLDKICDIFTQINSRGIRLDVFDLMNALLKPKGIQLKHLWRTAEPKLDFIRTERMNIYILQVMSILFQNYCSPKYLYYLLPGQEKKVRESDGSLQKQVLIPSVEMFEERWHEAVNALKTAIALLRNSQEFGAISHKYLPYASILPVFAAAQVSAQTLDARLKVRRWYWASVFTNRYSGSVESTSARDFVDLKRWFEDDAAEPALITEFKDRFGSLDLRRETKRGTSVYNGIFNLLVLSGARDWTKGTVPQNEDLDDHHIVPKSWGKTHALETSIDTILNRTPLTTDTNRHVIRGRLPNEYLPEWIKENGESTVRNILESHFISPNAFDILLRDPFTPSDYEEFLTDRQRMLMNGIEDLLVKERLGLTPKLRELDTQVEAVELSIRRLINEVLAEDVDKLPSHVRQNIDKRIQSKLKKNPGIDVKQYETLAGKLEYADLRDLEGIVTSKVLKPLFQSRFPSREVLIKHFDQFAELRNSIRHSRTVDEVTCKEGEAALVWFQRVLNV